MVPVLLFTASLVLVLFMVSFIPSELGLTMYSEFFGSPDLVVVLLESLDLETWPLLLLLSLSSLLFIFPERSEPDSQCWADFNLSTMADSIPRTK